VADVKNISRFRRPNVFVFDRHQSS